MKVLHLQRLIRMDVLGLVPLAYKTNADKLLRTLEARFDQEGFPFLDHLGLAYKEALSGLCNSGSIPDRLPYLGAGFGQLNEWGPRARLLSLAAFSWPSKLTFAGESTGTADWSGFETRSIQTGAFNARDWGDILPMSRGDRRAIQRLTQFRPSFGKHGPGATAERLYGWDKWLAMAEPTRPIIRMTSVPKDRLKRRLIGIEHAKMQFLQQALAASLRSTEWFRRWTNLEDQEAHVRFAATHINEYDHWGDPIGQCTIDLKDASDRIPLSLVEYLLPDWYPMLATTSSSYAEFPHSAGRPDLIPLGMMATMGNGFCFELETLVFHLVAALAGRIHDRSTEAVCLPLEHYASRIRVYGDDVIAPLRWYPMIRDTFTKCGWVINDHKTAVTPSFLETCGTYITAQAQLKRFMPSLATLDPCGHARTLSWETQSAQLSTAYAAIRAGLSGLGKWLAHAATNQAYMRWNHQFQRYEIKLTGDVEMTRPLNVVEETRYHAYWVCHLSSPKHRIEGTGRLRKQSKWVPWDIVKPACAGQDLPQLVRFSGPRVSKPEGGDFGHLFALQ